MKNGRKVKSWLASVMLVLAGVLFASVAWGGKTAGKAPNPARNAVADNGEEALRAEVKAEVGNQLLELVEAAAKLRQESVEEANPVLVAYNQLSREMERWFTLFALLGAVFGIIVPVIANWFQIKNVERYEDRVEKRIRDATEKAKEEFGKIIHDVEVAERELDGKVKKNAKEMEEKMAALWRHQSVSILGLVEVAKKKLVQKWKSGEDGSEIGFGLLLFFGLLEEGSRLSGKEKEVKDTATSILNTFKELRNSESAEGHWKDFVAKLAKRNEGFQFEFSFNEDLLGKETYREWRALCKELGIRGVE